MTAHQIALLKAVMAYLSSTETVSWETLKRWSGKASSQKIDSFKRHGASIKNEAVIEGAEAAQEALAKHVEQWINNVPQSLLLEMASDGLIKRATPTYRMPFFVDPLAVARRNRDDTSVERFQQYYEGTWRVFRPSSNQGPAGSTRHISRGLLSIHPLEVIKRRETTVPTFTLRGATRARAHGIIYQSFGRVFAVGARTAQDNKSATCLLWPFLEPDGEQRYTEIRRGIILHSNTAGMPFVSHFWAKFIEGSDRLSERDYEDLKRDENPKLDTYTETEITDAGLLTPDEIDALFSYDSASPTLTLFGR